MLQRSRQRLKMDNLEHTTDNMDHRNYTDNNKTFIAKYNIREGKSILLISFISLLNAFLQ